MDTPLPIEQPEPSSLTDRLTDVITAPADLYEEVKQSPVRASNWLVPWLIACVVTVIYMGIAFSQPPILRSTQEQRSKAFQKQVASGKMTQAEADQRAAMVDRIMTPTVMAFFGAAMAVVASACALFLMAVALWLALKMFAESVPDYMKIVEVCGLALVIDIPQKIIRILLVLWKQNLLATVSPTLFLANPSVTNKRDIFLSMFDLVDLWWLAVLTIGVSKVASVSYRTAGMIVFGIWFGFRIIMLLLTPGQQ